MSIPTLTVPAFIGPGIATGAAGALAGGAGPAGVVAVGAGLVALGAAAVVTPLLAVPAGGALAVGGVIGSSVLAVGAFLEAVQQLQRWGLINYRPQPLTVPISEGQEFNYGSGTDVLIQVLFDRTATNTVITNCDSGAVIVGAATTTTADVFTAGTGVSLVIGDTSATATFECGPGPGPTTPSRVPLSVKNAAGAVSAINFAQGDALIKQNLSGSSTTTEGNFRWLVNGAWTPLPQQTETPELPEQVRPRLFPPVLPDAPVLPAPPLTEPLETPVLPPPPDRRPLAPPVTIPRPGQQPAQVPVPGPRPGPLPGPGPAPVPAQPGSLPVPAIGPLPAPRPLPVPTTPGSVVVVDGQPISGPGQAPAPNLVAIAQELGRLERKNEILLSRPENGGLGELGENAILGILRGLLEQILDELLNDVPGGSYQLVAPCPPPGGGEPPPPVEISYGAGTNAAAACLARIDALAALIQAHKNMGQPTCQTPVYGEEVTVHFESP